MSTKSSFKTNGDRPTQNNKYSVETIENCTIIYGTIPINDFLAISKKRSKKTIVAIDIASRIGATIVFGLPDDIERLRATNLPISAQRLDDAVKAEELGAPAGIVEWLKTGDRGLSSDAMCARFFGIPELASINHPLDADDFQRCMKFLDAACGDDIHMRKNIVQKMRNTSLPWRGLVQAWDILEQKYNEKAADLNGLIHEAGRIPAEVKGVPNVSTDQQ